MSDPSIIDYASSHVLTQIREVAGETAVILLIRARGGRGVYLPETVTPECELASIVGYEAAKAIALRLSDDGKGRNLVVPTGRGHGHGRRLDWAEVVRLAEQGLSRGNIALRLGCTDRQIRNILEKHQGDSRQMKLFGD